MCEVDEGRERLQHESVGAFFRDVQSVPVFVQYSSEAVRRSRGRAAFRPAFKFLKSRRASAPVFFLACKERRPQALKGGHPLIPDAALKGPLFHGII